MASPALFTAVPFWAVQSSFIQVVLSISKNLPAIMQDRAAIAARRLSSPELQPGTSTGFGRCAMASFVSPSTRSSAFSKFLVEIGRELFGSYRPEKHYMRGAGPFAGRAASKAQEDNGRDANQDFR
ncbi:MAG: hypothetical protein KJ622_15730 [Alphaproteobacteria bacterium]|nr:hypothetical protein [Alphaproteobacteria bacterium]